MMAADMQAMERVWPGTEDPMPTVHPRYAKEEFARRGEQLYQHLRPQIEPGNLGKIVAIDIDTGAFETDNETLAAADRIVARYPGAQVWLVRVGHPAVHRFGPRALVETPQ